MGFGSPRSTAAGFGQIGEANVGLTHLLFRQLRTPPLMREHISDDGLRSLVDMDMLHADKLVTAMT
jgi:hypothetical protein